jgi:hypothetical protein
MGSGDEAAAGVAGNIHLAPQAGDMMAQAMVAQAMVAQAMAAAACNVPANSAVFLLAWLVYLLLPQPVHAISGTFPEVCQTVMFCVLHLEAHSYL